MMVEKILLAKPRGFCAGVDRAIEVVEQALRMYGKPIYVKHQIVHNIHVVKDLEEKGAIFVEEINSIPEKAVTVFSAHGVPPSVREEAMQRNLRVIDATCPLVTKVHMEAKRYANEGYSIILVGHRGHVELVGTAGESPGVTQIIETQEEVKDLNVPDENKVVCLTQTTLSIDDTKKVVDALKEKFSNIIFPAKEDICYATQNRQNAVKELVKEAELVLVLGSRNSSNSNRLVEVAKDSGKEAYLIDDKNQIKPEWLEGISVIGVTSGASAPDHLVQEVVEYLKTAESTTVEEIETIKEKMIFALPKMQV